MMLHSCRLACRFLWFDHEGARCSTLCPLEKAAILDQVPQARQNPNWGSSSSSQTTEFHFSNSTQVNKLLVWVLYLLKRRWIVRGWRFIIPKRLTSEKKNDWYIKIKLTMEIDSNSSTHGDIHTHMGESVC